VVNYYLIHQQKVSYIQALVHAVIFIICHHYLGKAALQAIGLKPVTESTTPKPMIGVMDLVCGTLFFSINTRFTSKITTD
jgi:hypothetical protein